MSFYLFIKKRVRSVGYAFAGAARLIATEPSIKVQFFIALVVTAMGIFFDITTTEWMIQIVTIAMVMGLEGMNTAVEEIADFVHPDFHERIGIIKDVAAGGVFIAAILAAVVGGIIYVPRIWELF